MFFCLLLFVFLKLHLFYSIFRFNMQLYIRLFLLYILSLLYQTMATADFCPKGCFCINEMIDCSSPVFPIHLPSRIINSVSIRGKTVNIPANAFVQPSGNLSKNVAISIYNIHIKHFEPKAFSKLSCRSLSIYNAVVDVMPAFLFNGLTAELLNIYNSNITTLETDVFNSTTIHKNIAFYNNAIDTVQKNALITNSPISIYLNKIKTIFIQESVAPNSFYLNKFQCSCRLIWMWKADLGFKKLLHKNKCLGPAEMAGVTLGKLNQSLLCKEVDLQHTSEWEIITTSSTIKLESSQSTTIKLESSQPTTGEITRKSTATAATNQSASKKLAINIIMMFSVATCFCYYFIISLY